MYMQDSGKPRLESEDSERGISFLVACCMDNSTTFNNSGISFSFRPSSIPDNFLIAEDEKVMGRKLLVLSDQYSIISNQEIFFMIKVD